MPEDRQFRHTSGAVTVYRSNLKPDSHVGVFYLAGHRNDFTHSHAAFLQDVCDELSLPLTQFNYWGWGGSIHPGVPEAGERYTAHWLTQAIELFDATVTCPQVIIGYSMGGMLMLGLQQARKDKVLGLMGLAAGFGNEFSKAVPERYGELAVQDMNGAVSIPLNFEGDKIYTIPSRLEGDVPAVFRNAVQDKWVSPQTARNIISAWTGPSLQDLKESDSHRFEEPEDRAWIKGELLDLINKNRKKPTP